MSDFDDEIERFSTSRNGQFKDDIIYRLVPYLAKKQFDVTEVEVRTLIKLIGALFRNACDKSGLEAKPLITKFRDAGRRSAPWKPTSSRVPGRPQDGVDGNRILRWKLPDDHKFYANEITATFVEIKYILQTLSMSNAPDISSFGLETIFTPWLLENELIPGRYLDPVQLIPIDFYGFLNDPRSVQSGHIFPLDRGGVHHPENTFLMLSRSNQIQGDLTVNELMELMQTIVKRHKIAQDENLPLELLIRKKC